MSRPSDVCAPAALNLALAATLHPALSMLAILYVPRSLSFESNALTSALRFVSPSSSTVRSSPSAAPKSPRRGTPSPAPRSRSTRRIRARRSTAARVVDADLAGVEAHARGRAHGVRDVVRRVQERAEVLVHLAV